MDMNSLSHLKWECKYHVVFAAKFRRKVIYGQLKRDKANYIEYAVQEKGCGDHRSGNVPGSCTHACKDTTKHKCIKLYGIFEGKEYTNDI